MYKYAIRWLCAIALLVSAATAQASFHLWELNEIYSNADGTVQFIELITGASGEQFLAGHAITSSQGATTHSFTFPSNLPGDTAGKTFLIGTTGFAALGVVTPDYIVPNGFLFTTNGSVNYAFVDNVSWTALPVDGVMSIDRFGARAINSPKNFAGAAGSVSAASSPTCTLTASPASIAPGGTSTLTASCTPAAISYVWSANTGFGSTVAVGTVSPSATTTYTVAGINGAGTGTAASATVTVASSPLPEKIVNLEEPVGGGTASGVGNVRGWAVSPQPIQRMDLYIDGSLAFTVPYGGSRSDVGAAYPTYPESTNSGFSMAYNFGLLSAGSHTFLTRALDNAGNVKDASATFNVVRFPSSFIANATEFNLLGASATIVDANTLRLSNAMVQGVFYTLTLRWNTAAQGFALTTITTQGTAQSVPLVPSLAESAAPAGDMIVNLEEPVQGGTASGVGNVRGWAVSPQPIQRVDLYIDGSLAFTVPYGGSRSDVGAAYPTYPGSTNSGFSMAYNFGLLTAGSHTFLTRALDNAGNVKDATATFNVVRLPSSFIANAAEVNLQGAGATIVDANTLRLSNVMVQGVSYDLSLRWNTATQGFALVGADLPNPPPPPCYYYCY